MGHDYKGELTLQFRGQVLDFGRRNGIERRTWFIRQDDFGTAAMI
jgi:hypothetical protein